jgi:hypothetical protein
LEISKVFKGKQKNGIQEGQQVVAVALGGRVRFPSGHMTTFILANRGFLDIGKQYLLFIWKPARTKTYMVAELYLIQDGLVFPINTEADVSAYAKGMPVQQFKAKVEAAIAQNVDID